VGRLDLSSRRALRRALVALVAAIALAPSSATARPNVLVLLTDDQRPEQTMQVMDATRHIFGRGGTVFPHAYVTTPQCCPSRSSIFSGRYAHNHGVWNNEEAESFDAAQSWQRYLHDAGYFTGYYGKYLNAWDWHVPPPYWDHFHVGASADHRESGHSAADEYFLAHKARRFLRAAHRKDGPWALFVAMKSPHARFVPAPRYADADVGPFPPDPANDEQDLADKDPFVRTHHGEPCLESSAACRTAQLRMLLSTDDAVQSIFSRLRRYHEGRRTLAVFASDNGFLWGDHGWTGKGVPYLDSVGVPLYLRWPGHVSGGVVDRRITANIDLAPTILDAADVKPGYAIDGRSLLDEWVRPWLLLEGSHFGNPTGMPDWYGYLSRHREYVTWADGWVEDYDLDADPYQLDARNRTRPSIEAKIEAAKSCIGSSCP
jgi:arylsulfatase A-like enzyme